MFSLHYVGQFCTATVTSAALCSGSSPLLTNGLLRSQRELVSLTSLCFVGFLRKGEMWQAREDPRLLFVDGFSFEV